jgi:valyl-tRNA synthetase
MIANWPDAGDRDLEAEMTFATLQELVTKIRNARSEMGVEPGRWIAASVHAGGRAPAFESLRGELSFLARVADAELTIDGDASQPSENDVVIVADDVVAVLPLAGMVDLAVERARLEKELDQARQERGRLEGQLGNAAFVERAPAKVVDAQRARLAVVMDQMAVLEQRLAQLGR